MKAPLRTWSPLFVNRYFTDLRTEGADVVLERDVLEEGILQHGLKLLVDLEAQLQPSTVWNTAVLAVASARKL